MATKTRYAVVCDKMTTAERLNSEVRNGVVVYDTDLRGFFKVKDGSWVADNDANDIGTGWAQYSDTVYTSGSPLTINQGNSAILTNNAGSVISTHLPTGVSTFWNNNKITPQTAGDGYLLGMDFVAWCSATEGYAEISLDIGGSQGVIQKIPISFPRGAGSGNARDFSETAMFYSLDTFIANGGELSIESVRGNINIYDIRFVISRFHKA